MVVSDISWDIGEVPCNAELPSTVELDGTSIMSSDEDYRRQQAADALLEQYGYEVFDFCIE